MLAEVKLLQDCRRRGFESNFVNSALTNRDEELIKFVCHSFVLLAEYSLGCGFIRDAMTNCFPDIIGVVWIPLDLFGDKFLLSNSNLRMLSSSIFF